MTRHRFDAFSFLAGATTVTIATLVLLDVVALRAVDLRVVGPVVILALGAALLVGGGRDREPSRTTSPDPADPDPLDDRWSDLGLDDDRDVPDAEDVTVGGTDPETVDTLVLDRDEDAGHDERHDGRGDGGDVRDGRL